MLDRKVARLLPASLWYFSAGQRTFIDALISWLQSPAANPRGYLFAIGGTAVSGILLAPVGLMFYRRLTAINRALAAVGSFFFAAGLVAAVLDRIAPSTHCDLLPRLRNQVALAR